jgi:hypothetical protein
LVEIMRKLAEKNNDDSDWTSSPPPSSSSSFPQEFVVLLRCRDTLQGDLRDDYEVPHQLSHADGVLIGKGGPLNATYSAVHSTDGFFQVYRRSATTTDDDKDDDDIREEDSSAKSGLQLHNDTFTAMNTSIQDDENDNVVRQNGDDIKSSSTSPPHL